MFLLPPPPTPPAPTVAVIVLAMQQLSDLSTGSPWLTSSVECDRSPDVAVGYTCKLYATRPDGRLACALVKVEWHRGRPWPASNPAYCRPKPIV